MDRNREFFMEVLRAGLWNDGKHCMKACRMNSEEGFVPDWNLISSWAGKQTVTGMVSKGISFLPEVLCPPNDVRKNIQFFVMKNMQMHELLDRIAVELSRTLKSAGIDSVLLKGQGLARVYDNPKLRQCGDIDLYVGRDNYRKACEVTDRIAERIARKGGEGDDKRLESDKHYHCRINGVAIEIHKKASILSDSRYNERFAEFEKACLNPGSVMKVDLGYGTVNVPPVEFDAVFVFLHAWGHVFSSGLGLRQVCDWTMYMHRYGSELDVDVLEKRLAGMGLKKGWQIFGYVAVRYLGLPVEECPLFTDKYCKEAEALFELVWKEGNFGHYSPENRRPRPDSYLLRKLDSLGRILKRNVITYDIDPKKSASMLGFYMKLGMKIVAKDVWKSLGKGKK